MKTEALAGSNKTLWPSRSGRDVIETLAGKTLNGRLRNQRQTNKKLEKPWIGRPERSPEGPAFDLFSVSDQLMRIFVRRRQRQHRGRLDSERDRIAFYIFEGDKGRFFFGRSMTTQTVETKARIRIIDRRVLRRIVGRLVRPVPAIKRTFLVLHHDGPGTELRALLGWSRKHLFDNHRAVRYLALTMLYFEPVPDLR